MSPELPCPHHFLLNYIHNMSPYNQNKWNSIFRKTGPSEWPQLKFTNPSTTQQPGDSESADPSVRSAACCDCESFSPLWRIGRSVPSMPARVDLGRVGDEVVPWANPPVMGQIISWNRTIIDTWHAATSNPWRLVAASEEMNSAICDFQRSGVHLLPFATGQPGVTISTFFNAKCQVTLGHPSPCRLKTHHLRGMCLDSASDGILLEKFATACGTLRKGGVLSTRCWNGGKESESCHASQHLWNEATWVRPSG